MTTTAAKSNFLRLLDQVAAGEEIEITRHGRPVARLVPPTTNHSLRGLFEGSARTTADEQDLNRCRRDVGHLLTVPIRPLSLVVW